MKQQQKLGLIAILSVFAVLSPHVVASGRVNEMDGEWWAQQSATAKLNIVRDLIEGLEIGYFDGLHDAINRYGGPDFVPSIKFSKSRAAYARGVDNFFAKYPRAMSVSVGAVVSCQHDGGDCDKWGRAF